MLADRAFVRATEHMWVESFFNAPRSGGFAAADAWLRLPTKKGGKLPGFLEQIEYPQLTDQNAK